MKILAAACGVLLVGLLLALWRIDHVTTALTAAEYSVTTLTNAANSRRNTQKLLAQLDTEHTEERERANKTNADLRAAVAAGDRRLSVKATCPAVRASAGAASLDHAEARADIDPATGERIVRIANDGDDAIRALTALQDYVRTTCAPAK